VPSKSKRTESNFIEGMIQTYGEHIAKKTPSFVDYIAER
jgi:hypothetical protein